MAPLPAPPKANALYSFGDVARGIFLETFYGGQWGEPDNVSGQVLSNAIFYSNEVVARSLFHTAAASELIMSKDFDLSFGLPRLVNGDMIVNVPFGFYNAHAGAKIGNVSGMITVKKIEGSTTEILGTKSTTVFAQSTAQDTSKGRMMTSRFSIASEKFKKNDTLRVTIDLYGFITGGGTRMDYGMGIDPQNRNDLGDGGLANVPIIPNDIDTIMTVQIPWKVDV